MPSPTANDLGTSRGNPPVVKTATTTTNTNGTLVSAVTGAKITVLSVCVTSNLTGLVDLKDGSTTKFSTYTNSAAGTGCFISAPTGSLLFQGTASTALNFTLTPASTVSYAINVSYIEDSN